MAGIESLRLFLPSKLQIPSLTGSKFFKTQVSSAEYKPHRVPGMTFSLAAAKRVSFGVQFLITAKYLLLQSVY